MLLLLQLLISWKVSVKWVDKLVGVQSGKFVFADVDCQHYDLTAPLCLRQIHSALPNYVQSVRLYKSFTKIIKLTEMLDEPFSYKFTKQINFVTGQQAI